METIDNAKRRKHDELLNISAMTKEHHLHNQHHHHHQQQHHHHQNEYNILKLNGDIDKPHELDVSFGENSDIKHMLGRTNLVYLQHNNNNTNHNNNNNNDIADLRHESLNNILRNNMEIVKHESIGDLNMTNGDIVVDEDNNNHILMEDPSSSDQVLGKSVEDQFSQLIDDEHQNGDREDNKVS